MTKTKQIKKLSLLLLSPLTFAGPTACDSEIYDIGGDTLSQESGPEMLSGGETTFDTSMHSHLGQEGPASFDLKLMEAEENEDGEEEQELQMPSAELSVSDARLDSQRDQLLQGSASASTHANDSYGIGTNKRWKLFWRAENNSSASPRYYSWRQKGKVTPARSQGSSGTCWAFGQTALSEAAWAIRHYELVDLSEQDIINCNCRSCIAPSPAQHHAKINRGVREESENPYRGDGAGTSCEEKAKKNCGTCDLGRTTPFRQESGNLVNPEYHDKGKYAGVPVPVDQIKRALMKHGPLYTKMHIPRASKLYSLSGDQTHEETLPILYGKKKNYSPHLVIITGWDDDKQAWEIKNSWGSGWGDKGFGWVRFGSNKLGMNASYRKMYAPKHRYTAVWKKGRVEEKHAHGWDYQTYRERYDRLWKEGWRLNDLEINVVDNQPLYNATWRKSKAPEIQVYGFSYQQYQKKYDELWAKGWRIFKLQSYVVNGSVRYTAVWRKGSTGEMQYYGQNVRDHLKTYDRLWKQGWRIHQMNQYVIDGEIRYDAIWRPGSNAEIQYYNVSYKVYRKKYDELWAKGWRLHLIDNVRVNGQVRYTAVWRPSKEPEVQVYGWNYDDFQRKNQQMLSKGWSMSMMETY